MWVWYTSEDYTSRGQEQAEKKNAQHFPPRTATQNLKPLYITTCEPRLEQTVMVGSGWIRTTTKYHHPKNKNSNTNQRLNISDFIDHDLNQVAGRQDGRERYSETDGQVTNHFFILPKAKSFQESWERTCGHGWMSQWDVIVLPRGVEDNNPNSLLYFYIY